MSSARPIARDTRRRDIVAAPGQVLFDLPVDVFSAADVAVWRRVPPLTSFTRLTTGFTVAAVTSFPGAARATFAVAPHTTWGAGVVIRIESRRVAERTTDVVRAGVLESAAIERELDIQTTQDQELRRDVDAFESVILNLQVLSDQASLTTQAGLDLITAADAAAQRTALGLVIGTNVQAQDAELQAIAGLTSAADRLAYFTGAGSAALATFTAFARTLLDDIDAAAARTTLGLGSAATSSTGDFAAASHTHVVANLSDASANGRSLMSAADYAAMRTLLGLGTAATSNTGDFAASSHSHVVANLSDASANGRSLISAADYAAMRTLLGLVIGTNVQAQDAELQAIAGLTSAADQAPYFTGSGTAALMNVTAFARSVLDDVDAAAARTTLGLGTAATQATSAFVAPGRAVNTATGLTGGGDLSADRTIALNITALTTENTIDTTNDVVVFHDASAGAHRKTSVASLVSAATAGVSTFNGRSGAVMPTTGDYTAAQVSALSTAGGSMNGDVTNGANQAAWRFFKLSGAAGQRKRFMLATNGVDRWAIDSSDDAESGSNAGSNFQIIRHNDAGGYLDIPFMINRLTGSSSFEATSAQIVLNKTGTTSYAEIFQARALQNAGGSLWNRLSIASDAGAIAVDVANQANTKLPLALQPYGGPVSVGTLNQSPASLFTVQDAQSVRGAVPFYQWHNTSAGTDLKFWRTILNTAGALQFERINDLYSASLGVYLTVEANGAVTAENVITARGSGFAAGFRVLNTVANRDYRFMQKDDGRLCITDETAAAERLSISPTGLLNVSGLTFQGALTNEVARPLTERLTGADFEATRWGVDPAETAATNTTRLNNCIAAVAAGGGGRILLPRGTINVNALASITANNIVLVGCGRFNGGTTLRFNNTTGDDITFSGAQYSGVRDIYFEPANRKTSGACITFTNNAYQCFAEKINGTYLYNGILVNGASETRIREFNLKWLLGDYGVQMTGSVGTPSFKLACEDLLFNNPYPRAYPAITTGVRTWASSTAYSLGELVHVNGLTLQCDQAGTTSSSAPNAIPGSGTADAFSTQITDGTVRWRFVSRAIRWIVHNNYADTLRLTNCGLINGYFGVYSQDDANTGTSRPKFLFAEYLEIDHPYGTGIVLERGLQAKLVQPWVSSAMDGSCIIIGANHLGAVSITNANLTTAAFHGIELNNGPLNVHVHNSEIADNSQRANNTYDGIIVAAGTSRFIFQGNTIGDLAGNGTNMQRYGVAINSGASDRYVVADNITVGNVTGGVIDNGSGSNKRVANNV